MKIVIAIKLCMFKVVPPRISIRYGGCAPLQSAEYHATISAMTTNRSSTHLPPESVREFGNIEQNDWADGISLAELLGLVNRVALLFLPKEDRADARARRVKRLFTLRSFRHYQTSGCIDPPARRGNRVFYGFHHFVQALLVRKLLWEQVPTERIAVLMAGRSTDDTKRMFLEGVEMVVRGGDAESLSRSTAVISAAPGAVEAWRHIGVANGVQLLLHCDLPKPRPAEVKEWMARIEAILRKSL